MIRYEDIEPYLVDFLQGKTTEANEYRIKAYLQQNPDFQQELDELAEMLHLVKKVSSPNPDASLKMSFYQKLAETQKSPQHKNTLTVSKFIPKNWVNRWVASAAVVAIIFMTGYWTAQQLNQQMGQELSSQKTTSEAPLVDKAPSDLTEKQLAEEEPVEVLQEELPKNSSKPEELAIDSPPAKEYALTRPSEDSNMMSSSPAINIPERNASEISPEVEPIAEVEEDIYKDLIRPEPPTAMSKTPAPDLGATPSTPALETKTSNRLQKVLSQPADSQKVSYLRERLQQDPSPNVRILAAERLENFLYQDEVQKTLFEALIADKSPVLQVTLLDIIAKHQLKAATPYIEQLLKQSDLETLVKEQAQKVLKVIS